jgi:hypothetical protein
VFDAWPRLATDWSKWEFCGRKKKEKKVKEKESQTKTEVFE